MKFYKFNDIILTTKNVTLLLSEVGVTFFIGLHERRRKMNKIQSCDSTIVLYAKPDAPKEMVEFAAEKLNLSVTYELPDDCTGILFIQIAENGISLIKDGCCLQGDFTKMSSRISTPKLNSELLIKAAKMKNISREITAIDATAGLGEDAFLLAAYGYQVTLYERDPVIALLLNDALLRASKLPDLKPVVERMKLRVADSSIVMPQENNSPDVILLDPMFPERKKSGLIKKKFQMLHCLEKPCQDEEVLLQAAKSCSPKKIIIKRPVNCAPLAGQKPSYSITGRSIRYDCIVL